MVIGAAIYGNLIVLRIIKCKQSPSGKSGSAGHHDIRSMHTSAILCCVNAEMGLARTDVPFMPFHKEHLR